MDSIGAGDAFCALASLASARGLPLPLATFMGQLAGAMAVRYVGNADCIHKPAFIRGGQTMLRF
jgi:sugar/nucleoside kinase (ribokinase family)